MERKRIHVTERHVDDADWATAAEQSSEDDEAQEGNVLAAEERSVEAAEHVAIHIVDDNDEGDADTDDIDIDDAATAGALQTGLARIASIDGVIAVVDPWSTGSGALRALRFPSFAPLR